MKQLYMHYLNQNQDEPALEGQSDTLLQNSLILANCEQN